MDARRLEHLLGAQHFLDLVLDGEPILEAPGHVRPHRQTPPALVLHDLRTEFVAPAGVLLEAEELAFGQLFHPAVLQIPYASRSSFRGCSGLPPPGSRLSI